MEHQSSLRTYAGEEAIQIRAIKPAPLGDFLETFFFFSLSVGRMHHRAFQAGDSQNGQSPDVRELSCSAALMVVAEHSKPRSNNGGCLLT